MRGRIAAGAAVVGLSLGVLGGGPVRAAPEDKASKDTAHAVCASPQAQQTVAELFDVKANRGQCQKALRSVGAGDAQIVAYLTGEAERPGPGDPDAVGLALITIDDAANQLCLAMMWDRVDGTLSGLHIHLASPEAPGPVVVGFATPPSSASGETSQCVTVANEAVLDDIAENPEKYYINLHSRPLYPGGAIRGQLESI